MFIIYHIKITIVCIIHMDYTYYSNFNMIYNKHTLNFYYIIFDYIILYLIIGAMI